MVEYINSKTKITIICKEHGIFQQSPNSHLSGRNCPECAKLIKAQNLRCSNQEIVNKFIKTHGDRYDYSLVHRNETDKVQIICKEHGIFEQKIKRHSGGSGCPKCGGSKKLEQYDVLDKFIKTHGDRYDYSLVQYVNAISKLKIICKEHGIFDQAYVKHAGGNGCPKCGGSKKLEIYEVIDKFVGVHGDRYDYSLIDRTSNKFKIICKKHGIFEQGYANHINGKGCPSCSNRISSKERELKDLYKDIFISSDRNIIKPLEIDLLATNHKFAIEYNGIMYHSSGISTVSRFNKIVDEKYHFNKTEMMEKKGYSLLHIFDIEFLNAIKKEIWISKINAKLGIFEKEICINNCIIREVSNTDTKDFLIINHIDGMITSRINYGIYYKHELIGVFCLKINNKECIIKRISIKNNINLSGVEEYIVNYIENNFNVNSILKIENRRWDSYINNTIFSSFISTAPNCFYFKLKKSKLVKIKNNDLVKTKILNMGHRLIFDSGYNIYKYIVQDFQFN